MWRRAGRPRRSKPTRCADAQPQAAPAPDQSMARPAAARGRRAPLDVLVRVLVEVRVGVGVVVVLIGILFVDVVEAEVVLTEEVVLILVVVRDGQPSSGPRRSGLRSGGSGEQTLEIVYLVQKREGRHRVPFRFCGP